MKKVLSLVLAFAMILGSFGFVFASDFSDVKDTEYYSEPVNVLSGLGVIAGFPDGTFKPGDNVTRAQMATMITAALGIPVKGSGATGFSDVPASHWASGYIAYAVSVGFVAGYPDGTFKPENPVSYNEALTMIVAALGYTAESLPGTWPGAFINKAQGLGIMDICSTTGNAPAPRQDIACFLYKALTQPIGYVDKDGAWHANVGADKGDDTMIKRLGAVSYNADKDGNAQPFVVTGEESSDINLQNYLGAYVTAYASKDDNTNIIAIKEVLSEFIEGDAGDLADDYKAYDTATKKDYVSFLNGDAKDPGDNYVPMKGNLKLAVKLSNKTIKEVYSVQVWNAAGTFRAADDIQDEIIDDQAIGGYDFALTDEDEIDATSYAIVGDRAAITELAEDDIVTVYLDKDSKIAKIEVSTKTVEGEVTKISNDAAPKTKYTIAGTAYKIADFSTVSLDLEDEGTFFLDYAGKIFDFDEVEGTSNYAIVLGTGADATRYGTSASGYIKLFMADGTTAEYQAISDVTGTITGNVWANTFANGTLVKYTLNSSDKVSELLVVTDKDADGNALGAAVTTKGEFDANGIYKNMALTASTIIFSYNGGDDDDADSYEVLKMDDMKEAGFDTMDYFLSSGSFKAVKVTGVSASNEVYALFVSKDAKTSDGFVWTALYDGKVQEMTLESEKVVDGTKDPTVYTTSSAVMYTLTFDSSNIVTKAVEVTGITPVKADVTNGATSVSGSVLKDGAKKSYSLDEKLAVYVYDESDDEWTAKTSSALSGRKGAFTSITLIDSDKDGDYDLAIVTKE